MEVIPREIRHYVTKDGKIPFREWFESLKDPTAQMKIDIRLDRVELGNFGDTESVGKGVYELRIDYGPGYRVYYAHEGRSIVLLLCGGDKRKQKKDIKQAQAYWKEHNGGE